MLSKGCFFVIVALLVSVTSADQVTKDFVDNILEFQIKKGFVNLTTPEESFKNFLKTELASLTAYSASFTPEKNIKGRILGSSGLNKTCNDLIILLNEVPNLNGTSALSDESIKNFFSGYSQIFKNSVDFFKTYRDELSKEKDGIENIVVMDLFVNLDVVVKKALEDVQSGSVKSGTAVEKFLKESFIVHKNANEFLAPLLEKINK